MVPYDRLRFFQPLSVSAEYTHFAMARFITRWPVQRKEAVFKTTPQGELKITLFYPPDWKAEDRRPATIFFWRVVLWAARPNSFIPRLPISPAAEWLPPAPCIASRTVTKQLPVKVSTATALSAGSARTPPNT